MSAFTPITGSGPGGSFIAGSKWGFQTAEECRQNFDVLAALRSHRFMGGSRSTALQHDDVVNIFDWVDIEFDGTHFQSGGWTIRVRVELRVENAALAITPKVRNITDGSDAVVGTTCNASDDDYSGTDQKQSLSFTPATGTKVYRVQITPTTDTYMFWAIAQWEMFKA